MFLKTTASQASTLERGAVNKLMPQGDLEEESSCLEERSSLLS